MQKIIGFDLGEYGATRYPARSTILLPTFFDLELFVQSTLQQRHDNLSNSTGLLMAEFPATRLSIIERIRLGDEDARREALSVFIEGYWPALVGYLVKAKGVDQAEAEDLVNDFMLNKIMNGNALELAGGKGRFRTALRTCIQYYLVDELRRRQRELKHLRYRAELMRTEETAEIDPLDKVWAISVLSTTFAQMKRESQHWGIFFDRVLTQPPVDYQKVVEKYHYEGPQQGSNALMTAKRTFNRVLSACIETQRALSSSDDSVDEEALLRVLINDPSLLQDAVDAMKQPNRPQSHSLPISDLDSVSIDFLDPSISFWTKSELLPLFEHLLDQGLAEFGLSRLITTSVSLRHVLSLNDSIERADIIALKQHFSRIGKKSRTGGIPREVVVTMTFALIGRFVLTDGAVANITSMSAELFCEGVNRLLNKSWIPNDVRGVFQAVLRKLEQL